MSIGPASLTLAPHDVLLGRGGATNNHDGNKRYRTIVADFQSKYLGARKKDKILIAREIVQTVKKSGGRFLKKDSNGNWEIVDDKRATEKTSQALREGLDVRNHTLRPRKQVRRYYQDGEVPPPGAVAAYGGSESIPRAFVPHGAVPHPKATPTTVVPVVVPSPYLVQHLLALPPGAAGAPMVASPPVVSGPVGARPLGARVALESASIPELQEELNRRALILQSLAAAASRKAA